MARVAVLVLLALVATAFAARVTIDNFQSATPTDGSALVYDPLNTSPVAQSASTTDSNVLGGARDIFITSTGASKMDAHDEECSIVTPGRQTANANANVFGNVLQLSNPRSQCYAAVFSRYDGTAAPTGGCDYYTTGCIPNGNLASSVDLSAATNFVVRAGSDLVTYFAVWLYSGNTGAPAPAETCGILQQIQAGTSQTGQEYTIAMSRFKAAPSAADLSGSGSFGTGDFPQNCNLGAIRAMELQLIGGLNWDQVAFFVGYDVPDLISISGRAFDDCNCQGSTGSPKNGVVVSLYSGSSATGTPRSTATTSGTGDYSFGNLPAGTYTVAVTGNTCSNSVATRTVTGSSSGINFFYSVQSGVLVCPTTANVNCGGATDTGATGAATVTAGCGSSGAVTSSDVVVNNGCANGILTIITRTFSASGVASCSQTINVRDTGAAPSLSNIPADRSIDCNAATDTGSLGIPTATGVCTPATVSVTDTGDSSGTCNVDTCSRSSSFTRTFTPVDQCGNRGQSASQIISRSCSQACPTCPVCPTGTSPAPRPVVGPLNCKFICDDADSSAVAVAASFLLACLLALLAL